MKNRGYCIIPNKNLISNIGFGNQATHAKETSNPAANLPVESLGAIVHPRSVIVNVEADLFTINEAFPIPSLFERVVNKLKNMTRKLIV